MAKKTAPTRSMSDDHKAALAEGREQGRTIRNYLEGLEVSRPKRGRKRTPETIQARLATIEDTIPTVDPLKRVVLIQERNDLEAELNTSGPDVDMESLEAGFIAAAKGYSERKGITYAAWREIGVPAAVLKAAGVSRAG